MTPNDPWSFAKNSGEQNKAQFIARMFARVSRRYDFLNTVITAGLHYQWRAKVATLVADKLPGWLQERVDEVSGIRSAIHHPCWAGEPGERVAADRAKSQHDPADRYKHQRKIPQSDAMVVRTNAPQRFAMPVVNHQAGPAA